MVSQSSVPFKGCRILEISQAFPFHILLRILVGFPNISVRNVPDVT